MRLVNGLFGIGLLLAGMAAPVELAAQVGKNLGGVVYADVATKDDLVKLPHVTPAPADALIAPPPLADMLAVDRVFAPLGADQKKELYARLFLPINLNTATRAEIMLVPGIGERIAHEFKEYRPYRNIEQFRREIGKYVGPKEVAQMERYVTIRP